MGQTIQNGQESAVVVKSVKMLRTDQREKGVREGREQGRKDTHFSNKDKISDSSSSLLNIL